MKFLPSPLKFVMVIAVVGIGYMGYQKFDKKQSAESEIGSKASVLPTALNKPADMQSEPAVSTQSQKIRGVIDTYLQEHPEIVAQALERHLKQVENEKKRQLQLRVDTNRTTLLDEGSAAGLGAEAGSKKLVVFVDNNCHFCRQLHTVLKSVQEKNPDLKVLIRQWPILGPDSNDLAKGMQSVTLQGKFESLHTAISESDKHYALKEFYKLAEQHGVDLKKLKVDIASEKISDVIVANKKLARDLGINGTPAIFAGTSEKLEMIHAIDEDELNAFFKKLEVAT